ncbi:MAG: TetR/AcrR family transcriptional regulator, partial [Candidatus Deferrimicrobium sp.]|nr:TetR/AcrR family transcriptional regulator [Candidatus Deferrimicrobium sp.]
MPRRGPNNGGEKRDRILRAAVKIFSRKGFFNSKVSEIARAAEVADGTIYLYFRNKDDLLISLFEEKMGEVVADVRLRIAAGGNALEKLRIFIENHMDLLERESGLVEVLQVELRQSTKFLKDYTPVKFFEYLEVISDILEEGKRDGVFRPDLNVSVARRAIFGALD